MRMRVAVLVVATTLTGCGDPQGAHAPPADMPARTWQYYVAHPADIEPMQKICLEWSASSAPVGAQPAVVTTNCREAAFARSQLQMRQ